MKTAIQAFNPNNYTHDCIIAYSKTHCYCLLSDRSAELISVPFMTSEASCESLVLQNIVSMNCRTFSGLKAWALTILINAS